MTIATYTVHGMTCGHCVSSVTEEVSALPNVTEVRVDLESGRLTVHGDVTRDQVAGAVDDAGYRLTP